MQPDELRGVTLGELAELLAQQAAPAPEAPRYADLKAHGSGVYRKALLAVKSGELRAFEPARRKLLVLREDFEAWLERPEHVVKPASAEPAPEADQPADELGELIELNRNRRRASDGMNPRNASAARPRARVSGVRRRRQCRT